MRYRTKYGFHQLDTGNFGDLNRSGARGMLTKTDLFMELVFGWGALASLLMRVTKAFDINCHDFFFSSSERNGLVFPILRKKLFCIFLVFYFSCLGHWFGWKRNSTSASHYTISTGKWICGYLFWWTSGTLSTRILVLIYVFPFRLVWFPFFFFAWLYLDLRWTATHKCMHEVKKKG